MSKDLFLEEEERAHQESSEAPMAFQRSYIESGSILQFTKQNVSEFHKGMRSMILEGGYGMFEYLEAIQFFCKLKELVFGADKKEGDKELMAAAIAEIEKHGDAYLSPRGVKFEVAEAGTRYDYTGNAEWMELNTYEKMYAEKRKALEAKLRSIPSGKALVDSESGETLIGPSKTSKTTIKITLGK